MEKILKHMNKLDFIIVPLCILIAISIHFPAPFWIIGLLFILVAFICLIFLSWSSALRNVKLGTLSLNPLKRIQAAFDSELNTTEKVALKYSLILLLGGFLSACVYPIIKTIFL